jgi:signal transduction histidine kinase
MAVFWFVTRRLVLQPVRELTTATQRVREGNLNIRADITTGDEFQQLGDTLNSMLSDLQASQDRLRGINSALDVKLHELSEANSALYQAAKVKGEFLASVSHELRTPLNSINGFAELLLEVAKNDAEKPDAPASVLKRIRYLENILTAGRGLLALINSLLEMARIEAGKVDLRIERVALREACEGLLGLISPQAGRKGITLKLEVADDVPIIKTDPRKFQQIVFNFLSNAVKFIQPLEKTGREPIIILRAERLPATSVDTEERIRVSVIDNGPGIPPEQQDRIFEKFVQLDSGYTKEQQSGTGLGLAICKDLATVLQSEIQLISDVGQGSMFSLIMPVSVSTATSDVAEADEERREAAINEMRERTGSR